MTKRLLLAGFLLLGSAITPGFGISADIPSAVIIRTEVPPVIDGVLDDGCWEDALLISDFIKTVPLTHEGEPTGGEPENMTRAYLTYDEMYLYMGIVCFDSDPAGVLTGYMTERDGRIWEGDCVEVFIDPGLTRENYFHIIINAAGMVFDRKVSDGVSHVEWDSNKDFAVKVYEDRWTVEMKIPMAELELNPEAGPNWGFNIARNEPRNEMVQSWSPVFGGNNQPNKFGILQGLNLDYSRFVCSVDSVDWGDFVFGSNSVQLRVTNAAKRNINLDAEVEIGSDGRAERAAGKRIRLRRGGAVNVPLSYVIDESVEEGKAVVRLREHGKTEDCFVRARYFQLPALMAVSLDRRDYFLSDEKAVLTVELNMEEELLGESKISYELLNAEGDVVRQGRRESMGSVREILEIAVAGLSEGTYHLKAGLYIRGKLAECKTISLEMVKLKGPFDW